jgi:hypothetical protein
MRLELTMAPPRIIGGTTSTVNPSSRPNSESVRGVPTRPFPKVKSYPPVTTRALSRSWSTDRAKSPGVIPPISPSNDSTTKMSIPSSSMRAAFSPIVVIS